MGHYASEMGYSSEHEARLTRIRHRQQLGFKYVNSVEFNQDAVECGECAAIVIDFKAHYDWHRGNDVDDLRKLLKELS